MKLAIADTGAGIAAEHVPRIFDPFFTTKAVGVGTGLGLWVCHQIVSTAGGEITVESKVGSGTRFVITLPIAATPSAPTVVGPIASLPGPGSW